MGENDVSSDDPPLKMTKDGGDIKFPKLGKISSKKDECSSDASPKPLYSNPKRRRIEHDTDAIISDDKSLSQSDIVDVSPVTKSRYGRTHKPKIPEDFLPTDKKVAAILGRSPHKSPGKVSGSPSSSTSVEMTKVCQKGRRLHDIFVKKDRRSKGNTESEELSKSINTENVKLEKLDITENIEDETAALTVMFTPETVKREATSDTSGVLVEKNKALNVEKSSEIDWVIGDLAWARVSGYPFWPCMIALDPQMGNFTRTTVRGNITLRSLHVQFFGDNGRRSWLYCNCVIPFEGLEALHKLSLKFQSEGMKKRFRKVAAAFHVGPKAKAKWDIAVAEAEDALKKTRIVRLQDFATRFPLDASVKSTKSESQSASPQDRQNVIKLVKTPKSENQSSPQDKQTVKATKIAKSENHIASPQQKQTVKTVKTAKSENFIASPQEKQTVKAIKIAKSNNRSLSPQEKQAVKATKIAKSVNQSASPQLKYTPKTSRTTKSEYRSPSRQSVKAVKVTNSENQSPSPQNKQSVKATRIIKSENQSPSPQNVKAIRITKSENQSPSPQNKQSAKAIRNAKCENQNASPQDKPSVKAIRITKPEDESASLQDEQGMKAINESASPQNKQDVKAIRITKPEDESAFSQDKDSVKAIRITKLENQSTSPQDKQSVKATRITKSENQNTSPQDKPSVKATRITKPENQNASPQDKLSVRPVRITKLRNRSASPYSRRSTVRHNKQNKRLSEINSTPKAVKSEDENYFRSPSPELPIDISTKELIPSVISDTKIRISSSSVKKKRQRKKYGGQKLGADFEAFLYKHIDRVTQEHPELSTKKVEKYLAKEWAEMDDQEKSKFCARLNVSEGRVENTEISSSEEDEDEKEEKDEKDDRESNSSEKADSSGTRESSPAPLFKLKKGGGLFRGTKQEKVCQICEKPGDTVKCRGPCCGAFHLECLAKLEKEKSESTANSVEDKENEVSTSSQNEDTSVVNENSEQIKKEDAESHKGINMDSKDEVVLTVTRGDKQEEDEEETENKKEVNTDDQNEDISNIGESGHRIKEEDTEDKKLLENVEETSEKIPENNCISSSAENNESIEEKESHSISRKRKRSESEEQMGPSEKKIGLDEERPEGEVVNEKIYDNCETEMKNKDTICVTGIEDSVKNGDDTKMDIDKVIDENIEKVNCEDKTKELDHVNCNPNAKESDEENTLNHDLEEVGSLAENKSEIKEDNSEGERNGNEVNDREKRDPEKVISKRERRSTYKVKEEEHKKGGDEDEVTSQKNEALSSQDKYKKETRGTVRRKEEEERKESESAGEKELKKDTKANPEEKDKDDKKDRRTIARKKDKEEKKGKSSEVEEKPANEVAEFRCKDCQEGRNPPCFGCGRIQEKKTGKEQRQRCVVGHCGKFYHIECLKLWPHASSSGGAPSRRQSAAAARGEDISIGHGAVTCPQHVCHTCASDDPRNATTRFAHERLVRCIRCPTAYHTGNYCLPAGSEVLTGSQIICPKHYKPPLKRTYHVNAAWCFICAMGGSLICCDLCPTAFHAECVKISPPEGSFICEDCDTGRFPLYGEIVWVKLGSYRWWPAQILYPNQIPENIRNLPHVRGEFAVRFFGSHDHYWVNRGRVFLYQEGDTGHSTNRKSYMEGMFSRALQEASEAQATLKRERAVREAEAVLKPPMYVKIKYNRPVGNVRVMEMDPACMTPCDCDPNSENPCGPDTDCLNRILLLECNPSVCMAGDRCRNQCFEKRLYPQLRPVKTDSRGWGLITLENIRKGDFVIEYVGEMIDEAEYQRRMTRKHEEKDENFYFLTIDKDRMLDAGPKGNVARFMNHSCQPNCETQKWTVNGDTRVGLFALMDIPAGRELTFNYNLECVGPDKKPCMCGAPNCSGFIGMKATKQQMEEDKKPRIDAQALAKRRYRKRRSGLRVNDDLCFICGEGGDLIICENKTCPKGYHRHCLKLKKPPEGKWLCPWHRCNVCHKRTIRRCNYCPNSFCPIHAEGNIGLHTHGFVCSKHDKVTTSGMAESLGSLAALNGKVGTEEEEVSEESSVSTLECNYISKEVETKVGDCDVVQNGSNNETKAVTAVQSVERDTMELNSSSSGERKIGTCDKLPDSSVESCAVLGENTAENGEVTIQNGEPSTNGDIATDLKIAVTDEQSTPVQNVTTTFETNNVVQKAKRGRPRKSVVQENLKNGNTNPPCTVPDEHQSVAVSSTNNETLQPRPSKFGRRYSEKFKSLVAEENAMLNGLSPGTTAKGRGRQRKISSVVSKPGFEEGSVHQEEQCNGVDFQADSTVKDEESTEKNVVKDVENASLHLKADSSIEVEAKCNETINGTADILSVKGIESSGVLILPIES